jgi:hypothetical protein
VTYSVLSNVQLSLYTTSATTDATGAVTIPMPAGTFSVAYAAFATVVRDTADPTLACFAMVRSFSASAVVVQVFESNTTTNIKSGGSAEGLAKPTSATTVLLTVFGM